MDSITYGNNRFYKHRYKESVLSFDIQKIFKAQCVESKGKVKAERLTKDYVMFKLNIKQCAKCPSMNASNSQEECVLLFYIMYACDSSKI